MHSEDIRRPLGLTGQTDPEALRACLDMYVKSTFPVGGKMRIAGLRLDASDLDWSHGDGTEVTGPAISLILAMTGRRAGLSDLSGPGQATLTSRMP